MPLHLQTDRPVYRPGDSLWYRGWTLDPRTSTVGNHTASLRLLSADGRVHYVSQHEDRDGAGVLWLPLSLPGGSYRLEATVGEAVVTRPITVLNYRTPRLASTIELDRKAYRPGEVVHAALVVKDETGGMIAGARVVFIWRIGHRELAKDEHTSDALGRVESAATLPDALGDGEVVVSAEIALDGTSESVVAPVPVTRDAILVDLRPEGGELVRGLRSRVYLRATDGLERPLEVSGTLVDRQGRALAKVATEGDGLGRFEVTAADSLALVLSTGERVELPTPRDEGCVLRATTGRKSLPVEVACTQARSVFAAVAMGDQIVHLSPLEVPGPTPRAFDLQLESDGDWADRPGLARVTIFDLEGRPLAERVVFRHLDRRLKVSVEIIKPDERPPEAWPRNAAELVVKVADHEGRGVEADLSIAVVDERVLALAPDDDQSLARDLLLGDEVRGPVPRPSYYFGEAPIAEREAALDRVLGTFGYRAFRWSRVIGPDVDTDGDGLVDRVDPCPEVARLDCLDGDGDRLLGVADRCPNQPEDLDGFQDEDGCPDTDNDRDGILDVDDPCPDDPTNQCRVSLSRGGDEPFPRSADPVSGLPRAGWLERGEGTRWERVFPVYRERNDKEPRRDLRATSLWVPRIRTYGGVARQTFTLSDAVTSHRVLVSGVSISRGGLVGQVERTFAATLPLSVTLGEVRRVRLGDTIALPVTVHNRAKTPVEVELAATTTLGPISLGQVTIPAYRAVTRTLPLTPTQPGIFEVRVSAEIAGRRDEVQMDFPVEDSTLRYRETLVGRIDPNRRVVTWSPSLPAEISDFAGSIQIIEGGLFAAQNRLADLLQEPHGCFEQSSAKTRMNLLVFELASATGKDEIALSPSTRELLIAGREKLMTFQTSAGGFALYPRHEPNEVLTSLGVLLLSDLARAGIPVDNAVRDRALAWLRGMATAQGYIDSSSRLPGAEAATAIILNNLSLAGVPLTPRELVRLERLADTEEPFALASTVWALALNRASAPALAEKLDRAARRLLAKQAPDGGVTGGRFGLMGPGAVDSELTSLALLALGAAGHHDAFERGITFLNSSRAISYATILKTQVLLEHARRTRGTHTALAPFAPSRLSLPGVARWVPSEPGSYRGRLADRPNGPLVLAWGDGDAPVEARLELAYTLSKPILLRGPLEFMTSLPSSLAMGEVGRLRVVLTNPTREDLTTPLIRVSLPAGLELVSATLDDLVAQKKIGLWEIHRGELVLYFERIGAGESIDLGVAVKAATPGRWGSAASSAYPYYDPGRITHAAPLTLEIRSP